MKKIIYILVVFMFIACSDESYEQLNRDPNNPTQVQAEQLFVSATKSLVDQIESTNVNRNVFRLFSQYWTQTTYTDESNYDLRTRSIPGSHWTELYTDVLFDLKDAKDGLIALGGNDAKIAQITILEVYTWQVLVDTFGDIPYSEALQTFDFKSPKYDDAFEIYQDLIAKLDVAIANANGNGIAEADLLYGGDMASWKKFANSLKLKLGSRLIDYDKTLATSVIEAAVSGGVFTSNADNCTFAYEGSTPNTNPLWVDLVQAGRNDFVPAETIVNTMNTLEDPRRPFYFMQNMGVDTYIGGVYGASNTYVNYTHIGEIMEDPTLRGVLMDFTEVSFNLAEAAEQGISVGGTAEDHYNNAITANMKDWGVSEADIATYLVKPEVAYATATGTWKEKIGNQYWLAMYNRGFEGWYVKRKFDTPEFNIPATSGLPLPKRYTYPTQEESLNEANLEAASAKIGGNTQQTPIFWDVN